MLLSQLYSLFIALLGVLIKLNMRINNKELRTRDWNLPQTTNYELRTTLRGFTMIEVALSLSILLIIFTMTIPAYNKFMVRNDTDIAVMSLVENFRRAQVLSQITDGDSSWGVHVATGSILIYKGINYVTRDQTYDEDTSVSASIVFSGLNDVLFSKQTGMPQSVGTTTLTSTTNEVRNVTINQKGTVDY